MSAAERLHVGEPMPFIERVVPLGETGIEVTWKAGHWRGQTSIVDLQPIIDAYKVFKPLRDNATLFATVHVIEEGAAIAWGDGEIDMPADVIEELTDQVMAASLRVSRG